MSDRWPLHQRVLSTFYRRLLLVARPLSPEIPNPPRESFEVRLLEAGDLPKYRDLRGAVESRLIQKRFEAGHLCFGAFSEATLVHSAWVGTGRVLIDYFQLEIELLPGDIYIFDTFTHPAFRRRGCTAARSLAVREHFLSLGYERSLGAVAPENQAARRTFEAAGYEVIGKLTQWRLGPFRHSWPSSFGEQPLPSLRR